MPPVPPSPLPPLPAVFLRSDARAMSLPVQRLRRTDVERIGPAMYRRTDRPLTDWASVGLPEPEHGRPGQHLWALQRSRPRVVFSHATAAHLHGLPSPRRPGPLPTPLDVTVPSGSGRIRVPGVRARHRPLPASHVVELFGLRVTSLERTVLDLCVLDDPWDLADVVAAADHAVRHPWTENGRRQPATTPARLESALRELGPFHGVRTARAVLERMRVGADSPYETFLRLALVDAGLPEPHLQARPRAEEWDCPEVDLYVAEADVALQYDGESHLTPERQAADARRDAWLLARGCPTLRVNRLDHREGYRRVIGLVRDRLEQTDGPGGP